MAPVLKLLILLLRIAKDFISRFPGHGVSLSAFLGRRLNTWCHFWLEIFGRPRVVELRVIGSKASSSVSVVSECVAASSVPASASYLHEHEHTESQTVDVPPVLTINRPYATNQPHPLGERSIVDRNSGDLSAVRIQSNASDRFSIITNSHESIRAPLGQPSRLRRATYPQLGCGLDQLRLRERASWPPAPTTRPPTHSPRLEIITALTSTHGDGKVGLVVQPSASPPYTHEPPSPLSMSETRRRPSSTIVVDIQNSPRITDEPFAVDSSTDHPSPDSPGVDLHDEPLGSPTPSNHQTLEDLSWPQGHFVQLINSDQIPRYNKNATMQVGCYIISLYTHTSCRPHVETAYYVKPLKTEFP